MVSRVLVTRSMHALHYICNCYKPLVTFENLFNCDILRLASKLMTILRCKRIGLGATVVCKQHVEVEMRLLEDHDFNDVQSKSERIGRNKLKSDCMLRFLKKKMA